MEDVIVIGAGPAGLSAALALKDRGIRPLVVDEADAVGESWRGRYDRLRLNTCRPLSHLPGRSFPRGTPLYPSRDEVVAHLERHAAEDGIELRLGTAVRRIARSDGLWAARTDEGDAEARQVVVATGYERLPHIPAWEGGGDFRGMLLHSSEYRNPEAFRERRVLVVGPGCSGMEIAYDLAEGGAARVWLSARTPPNIVLREGPGGFPGDAIGVALMHVPVRLADAITRVGRRLDLGDLSEYGLPVPDEGVFSRVHRLGVAPAVVDREVIDAIKEGRIEIVRGVESLDETAAVLADGSRVEVDAIVCATGFRRGLEPLVGHLGVLDERGRPSAVAPEAAAPGLRFVGFVPRPGALGHMAKEGRRAAKAIARELGV